MDQQSKLKRLLDILTEWLTYSKLWSQVRVEVITKTKVERANHEVRKKWVGPGEEDFFTYDYTELWVEKIPPTEYVKITYSNQKIDKFMENRGSESIEFPITDLDTRLEHYRNKLRNIKEKLQVTE